MTPLLLALACAGPTPPVPPSPAVADAEPMPAPHADVEPPTGPKPDGAECLSGDECASGICEGQGCGDDLPGECVGSGRACTRDLRPYCGCDGGTFFSGGNCPNRRFARTGTCDGQLPGAR